MSKANQLHRLSRRDFLKVGGCLTLGGLFASTARSTRVESSYTRQAGLPNFLIIVLDTLTARHMSTYGYERQTTPNISRFAERALVYHNHQAAGNYTPPGTASILTGTYPWSHRALHTSGTIQKEFIQRNIFNMFADDYYTLAYTHNSLAMSVLFSLQDGISDLMPFDTFTLQESNLSGSLLWEDYRLADWAETIIRGVGYPPASLFLSLLDPLRQRPRSRNVEDYREAFPRGVPSANLGARYFILENVVDWLVTNLLGLPTPFLAYFHLMPPHEPYTPRKEFVDVFADGLKFSKKPKHHFDDQVDELTLLNERRLYDEYLAYADAEFGRLYDGLYQSGALENTYLILTSDHGQLFERGIHGHITPTLFAPLLHVPLLISRPGQKQQEDVHVLTSAVDLAPTLAKMGKQSIPGWMEGHVLPGFGAPPIEGRSICALEAKESALRGYLRQGTVALIKDDLKLVHYFGYPGFSNEYELFNWQDDPEELSDIYRTMPGAASEMSEEIRRTLHSHGLIA